MTSIADISILALKGQGIRGIIFDVDNTLTSHHATVLHPRVAEAFAVICSQFNSVIYSNCEPDRHEQLRRMFSIPIIEPGLKKPKAEGFARAQQLLNLPAHQIAMIGDRVMTDIFGGNRVGFYTILVDPLDTQEPKVLTWIRNVEKWRLKLAGFR